MYVRMRTHCLPVYMSAESGGPRVRECVCLPRPSPSSHLHLMLNKQRAKTEAVPLP